MIKNKLTTIINNNLNEINKNQTNLTKFLNQPLFFVFVKKLISTVKKKIKLSVVAMVDLRLKVFI